MAPIRKAEELLPPAAADSSQGRPLTKMEDQESIIINRAGRSTHPKKSVLTSGATAFSQHVRASCRGN
jgi:hypothetical protein